MKFYLDKGAYAPEKAHGLDAGFDLRVPDGTGPFYCYKGYPVTVDTGVHVEIPAGYVGFLKSKSGLNITYSITGTGTIDAGYSGSIRVKLYSQEETPHIFYPGDKLIQLVVMPIWMGRMEQVDSLDEFEKSERGSDGFGSTGK